MKKTFIKVLATTIVAAMCASTVPAFAATVPADVMTAFANQNFNDPVANASLVSSNWKAGVLTQSNATAFFEERSTDDYALKIAPSSSSWGSVNPLFYITNLNSSDVIETSFDYNNGGKYERGIRVSWNTEYVTFKADGTVQILNNNAKKLTYDPDAWFNVKMYFIGGSSVFYVVLTDANGNKQSAYGYAPSVASGVDYLRFMDHQTGTPYYVDNLTLAQKNVTEAIDESGMNMQDFSTIDNTFTNAPGFSLSTTTNLSLIPAKGVAGKAADDVSAKALFTGTANEQRINHWIGMGDATTSKLYSFDYCNLDTAHNKNVQIVTKDSSSGTQTQKTIYFSKSGQITFSNNTDGATGTNQWPTLQNYIVGNWYHFDILLGNENVGTTEAPKYPFKIYIDGALKGDFTTNRTQYFDNVKYAMTDGVADESIAIDNVYYNLGTTEALQAKIVPVSMPDAKFYYEDFSTQLEPNTVGSSLWAGGIDGTKNTSRVAPAGGAKDDTNTAFYIKTNAYEKQEGDVNNFTDPMINANLPMKLDVPMTVEFSLKAPVSDPGYRSSSSVNLGVSTMYTFVALDANGSIYINETKYGKWVPGEWYNFAATLYPGTDKIDYYMNGDIIEKDATFMGGTYADLVRLKLFTMVWALDGTPIDSEVAYDDIIAYRGAYDDSAAFSVSSDEYTIKGNEIIMDLSTGVRANTFLQKIDVSNDAGKALYEDSAFEDVSTNVADGNVLAITSNDGKIVKYYEVKDVNNYINLSYDGIDATAVQAGDLKADSIVDAGSMLVLAAYDKNGALIDVWTSAKATADDQSIDVTASLDMSAAKVKTMIWSGLDTMTPVAQSKTLK